MKKKYQQENYMGETWAICEDGKFAICLHSPQKGNKDYMETSAQMGDSIKKVYETEGVEGVRKIKGVHLCNNTEGRYIYPFHGWCAWGRSESIYRPFWM